MSRIAVVHPNLNRMGGAEAVCMNIINATESAHTVDLISLTEPNESELEAHYDIPLSADDILTSASSKLIDQTTSKIGDLVGVGNLGVLDVSLINRIARYYSSDYDLMISSMSEMYFDQPSIQYIHYPNFYRTQITDEDSVLSCLYEPLCQKISSSNNIPQENTIYVTNSAWTSEVFKQIYNTSPSVVYPPVDTREFDRERWDDRTEGILVVGRISRPKRIDEIITLFEKMKNEGYEGALHIVGPIHDRQYFNQIKKEAQRIPEITLDGKVNRRELINLMSSYKYGVHGKKYEHFGMVVAEFVAAGMIPFVPSSGGQTEIINNNSQLMYDSWDELLRKLLIVIDDTERQMEIRSQLPDIQSKFGLDRFQKEFLELVNSKVESESKTSKR